MLLPTSPPLTGTSKLRDSNERLNLLTPSRSAGGPVLGAPGPPRPQPRASIWSLGKAPPPRRGSARGWGGSPPPARPPSPGPGPAREPRDPRPAARSADPARPPAPRPPPGFRSPGPAGCARCGSARGGEVMLGLITMRKAVPGKASSTRLSISLSGGGGAGQGPRGATGKLGGSCGPRRPEEVACAPSWEAVGERGAGASSLARELKPPHPLPPSPSLSLAFSALPALSPYFLEILSQLHFLHSPFFLFDLSLLQSLVLFLNSLSSPSLSFLPPLCVQIYHFVLKTQC